MFDLINGRLISAVKGETSDLHTVCEMFSLSSSRFDEANSHQINPNCVMKCNYSFSLSHCL